MLDQSPHTTTFLSPQPTFSAALAEAKPNIHVGAMKTFWNAAKGPFLNPSSPLKQISDAYEFWKTKAEGEGPLLTKDQISELQKNRPGLDIPVSTHQNIADLMVKNYDARRRQRQIAAEAKPGFLSTAATFLGANTGSLLAFPRNTLAYFMGPELIGAKRAVTSEGLMNRALERAQTGLKLGGAIGVGQTAQEQLNLSKDFQQLTPMQAALSIGAMSLTGGALDAFGGALADKMGTVFGVNPEVDQQAKEIALGQLVNGKDVNVTPVINEGTHQAANDLFNKIDFLGKDIPSVLDHLDEQAAKTEPTTTKAQGIKIIQSYLKNRPGPPTQSDLDTFIKHNTTTDGDFSDAPIEPMEPAEPVKTIQDVTKDVNIDPQALEDIQNKFKDDDEFNQDMFRVQNEEQRKTQLPKLLDAGIKCLTE